MDPRELSLWQEADVLLDRLLDLPEQQRRAALESWTVPDAVRERVLRLLAAHESGGMLDSPPAVPADMPQDDLSGRVLGRWRLLSRIGEGGMAVVYRAVSVEPPLDQEAAVKILALGSLARDPLGRSLAREQALLARLRHPFIAPFHEAGIAADGTPWLAMGLVEGERIDAWCDRTGADVRTRVRLVLDVADAVAYAHRNLVIHRDIKPSNVLVDDGGRVRLLDFGIGQLLDIDGERTATAMRALTPGYAAPEQFTGEPPSTAVDVYGLGALLYRLLTGEVPPPPDGVPWPGAREAAAGTPRRRLRGDLQTIVGKALAARPQDRYASVDALAEDLRRWLEQRPILARGPGPGYRLRLFVRRNRLAVGAGLALLLALAAGVAGTLWQARRATEQAALAEAAAARARAQSAYLDALLEDLVAPTTPGAARRDTGELIRVAAERAGRELAAQPDALAAVETSLAEVAGRAGYTSLALSLAESAHDRLASLAGADAGASAHAKITLANLLSRADPPDPARARALVQEALEQLRGETSRSDVRVQGLVELAVLRGNADEVDEAAALLDEGRELCRGLPADEPHCDRLLLTYGSLLYRIGRHGPAADLLQELVDERTRRLGADHVSTLFARTLQAQNMLRAGQPREARAAFEAVLTAQREAYGRPTADTLRTLEGLTEATMASSDLGGARRYAQLLLEEARAVDGDASQSVAMAWSVIGTIAFADGDYAAAVEAHTEGRRLYAMAYGADSLATLIMAGNVADALRENGSAAESLAMGRRLLRELEQRFPAYGVHIAARLSNAGRSLVYLGRAQEALPLYERAVALYREHVPQGYSHHVVAAYHADALRAAGRLGEARDMAREALTQLRAVLGDEHRFVWEALAAHVAAACASPAAPDCAGAAAEARAALRHPAIPGHPARLLRRALAGAGRA